tara:strand:- start:185 stop:682 length:498 start_codon:yes stop_codon:yes gene_type:complete
MTRAERSRHVMKLAWQIFRSSECSHSEAMKLAHQQIDRKVNPERASRRIRAHVRETFESIPEQVRITSGLKAPVYVPVDISSLPTGPMKLSSVYRRGWTTGLVSKGGVGVPSGCGRTKSEMRSVSKQLNRREIQVSRDEKRTLIPTDMLRLAPVYKGHTSYREYQ